MKQIILTVLLVFSINFGFAYVLKTESLILINNEPFQTIYYENEPDGMIKKEFFGTKPVYRLVIEYFDNTNGKYFDRIEFNNLDYSNPQKPNGTSSSGTIYYRNGNPEGYTFAKIQTENGLKKTDMYFIKGIKTNKLQEEYISVLGTNNIISLEQIFADETKAENHISILKQMYNEDQQIIEVNITYFENSEFYLSQKKIFLPPRYLAENNQPYQVLTVYKGHPDGLLRSEAIYDLANSVVTMNYYNPNSTSNNYTRRMDFNIDGIIKRKTYYFDNSLLQGNIYFFNVFFNDDGSIKETHYFDAEEKEVQQK